MDRKLWLLAVCVTGLLLAASGQKSETKTDTTGQSRYRLVSANQEEDGKLVFVLDAQTGKVWKYQPASTKPYTPEAFLLVGFGIPAVGVPGFNLRNSASEYTGGVRPEN